MASVNKVILIGNLGRDPDVRYNPNGFSVANFSVATTHVWTDKQSGTRREDTEWHRVVAFGAVTDIIERYLKKGSQVYIEGRLKTRKWQDKAGKDQYTTEVVVESLQILGSKSNTLEKDEQTDESTSYEYDEDEAAPF